MFPNIIFLKKNFLLIGGIAVLVFMMLNVYEAKKIQILWIIANVNDFFDAHLILVYGVLFGLFVFSMILLYRRYRNEKDYAESAKKLIKDDQKEENSFRKLTAVDTMEDTGGAKRKYTEALDFAIGEKNINNIAITGIFGSGKSSIWNKYVKEKSLSNIITITLENYQEIEKGKEDEIINSVEKQIINQIIAQVDPGVILKSKYSYKYNNNKTHLTLISTMVSGIVVVVFILVANIIQFESVISFTFASIIFFILCFTLIYFIGRRGLLRLIKLRYNESEAEFGNEENEDTILNTDTREIVYILSSSGAKYVVFEDLDRFEINSIELFTKLKHLNFALNSFKETYAQFYNNDCVHRFFHKKIVNENVKFLYLLRDGVFDAKNRLKFFDIIIPVIPFIDSVSSKQKLIYAFEEERNIDIRSISEAFSYINDMRQVNNIINEYDIYSSIITESNVGSEYENILAIIILKNVFPNEFDLLQQDKGYLYFILNKYNHLTNELRTQINEISFQRHRKESCEERQLEKEKIRELVNRLITFKTTMKDFLATLSPSERYHFFRDGYSDSAIFESPNFPLIEFFISKGFITEDYKRYVSFYFYTPLEANDKRFLKCVYTNDATDNIKLRLNDAGKVLAYLNDNKFESQSILNVDLLITMIRKINTNPNFNWNWHKKMILKMTMTAYYHPQYVENNKEYIIKRFNSSLNSDAEKAKKNVEELSIKLKRIKEEVAEVENKLDELKEKVHKSLLKKRKLQEEVTKCEEELKSKKRQQEEIQNKYENALVRKKKIQEETEIDLKEAYKKILVEQTGNENSDIVQQVKKFFGENEHEYIS